MWQHMFHFDSFHLMRAAIHTCTYGVCVFSILLGDNRRELWCGLLRHRSPKQRLVQWDGEAVWQLLSHHSHEGRLHGLLQQRVLHFYTQNGVPGLQIWRRWTSHAGHDESHGADSGEDEEVEVWQPAARCLSAVMGRQTVKLWLWLGCFSVCERVQVNKVRRLLKKGLNCSEGHKIAYVWHYIKTRDLLLSCVLVWLISQCLNTCKPFLVERQTEKYIKTHFRKATTHFHIQDMKQDKETV